MNWETNYLEFKNRQSLDSVKAAQERQAAFERFNSGGLPTRKEEAWKFTSLNDFKEVSWSLHADGEPALTHEQMQEISRKLPSEFANYVFVNGVLNKTLSDDEDGILSVLELEEADFDKNPDHVEHRIINLAQSFLNKKIKLALSKNKTAEKPVQILFVQSSAGSVYLSEKVDLILEENSEMKLIVNSISFVNSSADAMNVSLKAKVGKNSRLTLVQLQDEDLNAFHFSQIEIEADDSAHLLSVVASLGNRLTRNYYRLSFTGENASAFVYGLGVLDANQHLDNYTFIEHRKGKNQSVQQYKSILSGSSHSVFRGRILIAPDAQKADSQQINNNLLLTRSAQADSIPQLEIFADDVKAGHGATVGQLNKDEIFYFLSRGIDQYEAVRMLSYGFAKELIYKLEDDRLRSYLLTALNSKLEKMVKNGQ